MCAAPTVVLVKDNHESIFGAFVDVPWRSGALVYVNSTGAFLFCLRGARNFASPPSKMVQTGGNYAQAMHMGSTYGPIFGGSSADELTVGMSSDLHAVTMNVRSASFSPGPMGNFVSASAATTAVEVEVWAY
jgi:hypothetical protein